MATVVMVFAVVLLFLAYFKRRLAPIPKNYPPGPGFNLPVIGHLAIIGEKPYETMLEWSKKYGPIISVQLGSFPAVFLNSSELIRAAFKENVFSGRPRFKMFRDRCNGVAKGIFFTQLDHAFEYRRFVMRSLTDFGVGKASMESILSHEASDLVNRLKEKAKGPTCLLNAFHSAILNSLWCVVTGERFQHEDPKLATAIELMNKVGHDNVKVQGAIMFLPWLSEYFPRLCGYKKVMEPFFRIQDFVSEQLERLEKTYQKGSRRGLVDVFIEKMRETNNVDSPFHEEKDELKFILMDLFVAGTETTSTALSWACLLLAGHSDVQKKMQKEIDSVVGRTKLPALKDRKRMPFTSAVMNEVQRFGSLAPIALFHRAMKTTSLRGFRIEKDTIVVPNIYAVHHDKEVWGDPETFRPDRFLDENGGLVHNENLIPFSVGKRVCIGESLAKDEFFLCLTALFQAFTMRVVGKIDTSGGSVGVIRCPKPHNFFLTYRDDKASNKQNKGPRWESEV